MLVSFESKSIFRMLDKYGRNGKPLNHHVGIIEEDARSLSSAATEVTTYSRTRTRATAHTPQSRSAMIYLISLFSPLQAPPAIQEGASLGNTSDLLEDDSSTNTPEPVSPSHSTLTPSSTRGSQAL